MLVHPERFWAVIPAAGVGKRMQLNCPKQYLHIQGKTILQWTLEIFLKHPRIAGLVVVLGSQDEYWPEVERQLQPQRHKKFWLAKGGAERQDSVLSGLQVLKAKVMPDAADWVMVHDAARPCLAAEDIDRLIAAASDHPDGVLLGLPVNDTVKRCDAFGKIQQTIDRNGLWRALTPQSFPLFTLLQALQDLQHKQITDEASAMEQCGFHPLMITGSPNNIKVTVPADVQQAEQYLSVLTRKDTC